MTTIPTLPIRAFLTAFEGDLLHLVETLTPDETAYLFLRVHQIADKHDPAFLARDQAASEKPRLDHSSWPEHIRSHIR
jgi:hypothetical protein